MLTNSNVMINQKKIRALLRKTENKFISKRIASRILKSDGNVVIEILTYLEDKGFIEKSKVDGLWQQSIRGKLLSHKRFDKEYKVDTLRAHLNDLIERVNIVNSSEKFPDCIACIKIISEYPIEYRSNGIKIAYSLKRKEITDDEYESAARELRNEYTGTLGNIVEYIFYPHKAIQNFLKARSHVLKLRKYEDGEIKQIIGYKIFGEEPV